MAGESTKLGLTLIATTDQVNFNVLVSNFGIIDSAIGAGPVSSFPDSSTYYEGMSILLGTVWFVRANSSWVKLGAIDGSLGRTVFQGLSTPATANTYTTSETGPIYSVTANFTAGRIYWIEGQIYTVGKDNPDTKPVQSILRVRFASGASVTTAGTQLNSQSYISKIREGQVVRCHNFVRRFIPPSTGQFTIGVFALVDSSVNSGYTMDLKYDPGVASSAVLAVRDMGPA